MKIRWLVICLCFISTIWIVGCANSNGAEDFREAKGFLDESFQAQLGEGYKGPVDIIKVLPSGKILVAGRIESFNGEAVGYIHRLNADGSPDLEFQIGSGFNDSVYAVYVEEDESLLVGGAFTSFDGTSVPYFARLDSQGRLDTNFLAKVGSGFDGHVKAIVKEASSGKIWVGGEFSSYRGAPAKYFAVLDGDGGRDLSKQSEMALGFNLGVGAIEIEKRGTLLFAGSFTQYLNESIGRIFRVHEDASVDTNFALRAGTGFDAVVRTLTSDADGALYVGGDFENYNGSGVRYFAKLDESGSLLLDFAANRSSGSLNGGVNDLALQPDGKILLGGNFTAFGSHIAYYFIRLDENGLVDTSFLAQISDGLDGAVRALAVQDDGKILVGGQFSHFGDKSAGRLLRLR